MSARWRSALDTPSLRDTALLAEVLRSLRGQLEGEGPEAPTPAEVEDLVSHAVAELQRLEGTQVTLPGIAPALGAGVLQELLRQRRDPAALPPVPSTVDTKR